MKCDNCFAYVQVEGRYTCEAEIDDIEVKTFSDGKCGCKYKTNTVKELVEKARAKKPIQGQMEIADFLPSEEDDDDFVLPEENENRETFLEKEKVKSLYSDDVYTVKSQSKDKLVVFVESKTAGTQVIAASDLVRIEERYRRESPPL